MKKIIKKFFIIIFCISILGSLLGILFDNSKELRIKKDNSELVKYISEKYDKPEEITRIKFKMLLGDGELSLYQKFSLKKKTLIVEGEPLFNYIIEHGKSNMNKYIKIIVISSFGILGCKKQTKDSEK